MHRLAVLPILALLFFAQSAFAMREDVLVVVNDNSINSPKVANYYAQARNIDPAHIVHVSVPDQYTISWTQFLSLRDQILRNGICPTVPAADQPAACTDATQPIYTAANVSALTDNTPIRYIVTTMGVPSQMYVDDSPLQSATMTTSVDNYLMFWLAKYRSTELAAGQQPASKANPKPTSFPSDSWNREITFGDGRGMRPVDPAKDDSYIIGRIDGVDLASAEALVNRAISAEQNGIYGMLYGDTFGSIYGGSSVWQDYATGLPIYPEIDSWNNTHTVGTGWRYAFGLFNTSSPACIDYQNNYMSYLQYNAAGKAPTDCSAQMRWGNPNEFVPGVSYAREPMPVDALGYIGSLDGQTIMAANGQHSKQGGFDTLLNWRKYGEGGADQVTLCANAANPKQCEGQSTDPYKEINTNVVGVANGFIGYNFQSFPVSRLGIWPTDWQSYFIDYAQVPVVVHNDGVDNQYSLWYEHPDQVASPQCPGYSVASGPPTPITGILSTTMTPCYAHRNIDLMQVLSTTSTSSAYTVSFYMKGKNIPAATNISTSLRYYYKEPNGTTSCPAAPNFYLNASHPPVCEYTAFSPVTLPAGNSDWTLYTPYTNAAPPNVDLTFEKLELTLISSHNASQQALDSSVSVGRVGFDEISVKDASGVELVDNGSFDQGHEQTANGDWAANFLDRLGGTAFWGSLSHHGSGGHNFDSTSLGTLVYFMRGLPLGDAVWLGARYPSGDLYGDPLYSPMAIKFNYLNTDSANRIISNPTLSGSTINGRNPSDVSTSYTIDYCPGSDFYVCDQNASWTSTGLSGTGGQANQSFGTWDMSHLPYGTYTLRLAVTSTNSILNRTQTFDDYYTVVNHYLKSEIPTYSIFGTIKNAKGQPMPGVKVAINDNSGFTSSVTTNLNGDYSEAGLKNKDTYLVDPVASGYSIVANTGNGLVTLDNASMAKDFTATQSTGTYSISGTITDANGQPMAGVNVAINDNAGFTSNVTTNVNGYYSETGLKNGDTYLVNPSAPGYTILANAGNGLVTIDSASVSGKDFTGAQSSGTYTVSGTISNAYDKPMPGVTVKVTPRYGTTPPNVTTNSNGHYTEAGLTNNSYLVSPVKAGYSFGIVSGNALAVVDNANATPINFTAKSIVRYSISGYVVADGQPLSGVSVQVANNSGFSTTVTTDASGYYIAKGLTNGTYLVTPMLSGYSILPSNSENDFQTVYGGNVIGKDFAATAQ